MIIADTLTIESSRFLKVTLKEFRTLMLKNQNSNQKAIKFQYSRTKIDMSSKKEIQQSKDFVKTLSFLNNIRIY